MASMGAMIYIMGRGVPRVGDDMPGISRAGPIDRVFARIPLEKIDAAFFLFLEKILRRTRWLLMRIDNAMGGYLDAMKKTNGHHEKNGEMKSTLFGNGERKEGNGDGEAL